MRTSDPGYLQGSHAHQLDRTHIHWERFGERVFGLVKALNNLLKCLVLCDQLICCLRPNPTNCSAIVTSTQDTDVDKLLLQTGSCCSNGIARSVSTALSASPLHAILLQVPIWTNSDRRENEQVLIGRVA